MISFLIPIKDQAILDFHQVQTQTHSCLSVSGSEVHIGLSSDNYGHAKAILDLFKHDRKRVKVHVTDDKGLYDGWNKLVALAGTDYVCFLGLGDLVICPKYFETLKMGSGVNAFFSRVAITTERRQRIFGRKFNRRFHQFRQHSAFVGAVFSVELFGYQQFDTRFRIAGDYEWLLRASPSFISSFEPVISVWMPAGGMSEALLDETKSEVARAKKSNR